MFSLPVRKNPKNGIDAIVFIVFVFIQICLLSFILFVVHSKEPQSAINANSDDSNLQNMNDEGMEEDESHDLQTNGGSSAAHGSATNTPKEIKFNVHHKYTTHNVTILDRLTIGKNLN